MTAVARGGTPISLSEILQGMGMVLPQFLVALTGEGMSLKEFTARLQARGLTQREFSSVKGSIQDLLAMLKEGDSEEAEEERTESTTTTSTTTTTTTTPATTSATTPATTSATSTTTTTASPTTTRPTAPPRPPKIFGFLPGGRQSFEGARKPGSSSAGEGAGRGAGAGVQASEEGAAETPAGAGADEGQSPIPIKVDLAAIMKDKGLSASDILHDLGSIFSLTDSGPPKGGAAKDKASPPEEGKGHADEQGGDGAEPRPRPYTTPETPVSLRPYRTSAESGRRPPRPYRPLGHEGGRSGDNYRRILTNRFQTTERTTLRPPYVPPPYNPESDLSSLLEVLHNSGTNTEDGSLSFGLSRAGDSASYGDEHRSRPLEDDYFPLYDDDPNSLNMSTKSAIMAASILGGVAMCVFLAILVVVMYRGRARNRRVPLALPSDASSSSTPPIYSTRMSVGKGAYKSAGFWGTLKKRFDPYSLSSTPTTMS